MSVPAPLGVPGGTQPKAVVYEALTTKSLFFSLQDVQSHMHILRPEELQLEYTRIMMGFLLHQPQPVRIAMIGLGGGSLAKFCYRYLPDAVVEVAEINPHVLALRDSFAIPANDHRFCVQLADGAEFVKATQKKFDVLLADGFDVGGLPEALSTQQYYDDCFRLLQPGGVLVANLHGPNTEVETVLARIRCSFHGPVLTVQDPEATNRIAFAVKGDPQALLSLAGVRRPAGFDDQAWHDLMPSLARVFLASRELKRDHQPVT